LHKHPKEQDYSLGEMADIIFICRELEKQEVEKIKASAGVKL